MFLAHRTSKRFRVVLAIGIVYALVAAAVAALFPHDGKSFSLSLVWWAVAIPAGLVVYATLELFGTWGLELTFWQRMPSWGRIVLLVALIGLAAVGTILLGQYFEVRRAA